MENIKQIYRFRKFIRSILIFNNDNHKECVLLDNYIYNHENLLDENLKSLVNIAKMISNNSIELNYEFVNNIYTSYYPKKIKKTLNNGEIAMVLNFIKNEDFITLCKFIFKYNIFGAYNFYMCYCLYNKYFYLKNGDFIIICRNYQGYVIKLLKENNINKLQQFLKNHNNEISKPKEQLSIDEIKNRLNTIDKNLLDFLCVKRIYLFGSLANGNSNDFSDIDLLILTDSKSSNDSTNNKLLYMDISSKLGYNINIVTHDLNKNADKFIVTNLLDAILLLNNGVI